MKHPYLVMERDSALRGFEVIACEDSERKQSPYDGRFYTHPKGSAGVQFLVPDKEIEAKGFPQALLDSLSLAINKEA